MTEDKIALRALLEKGSDATFLREMIGFAAKQLPEETLGRIRVTVLLNQDVQNHPILINGSPEIMDLAPDPDEDLIQVPFISRLRPTALEGSGILPAEANAPFTDAFVADGHATSRQDQLDIPQAEAEAMIQPDRVGDDLRRKTEASVGILVSAHGTTLSQDQPGRQADNTAVKNGVALEGVGDTRRKTLHSMSIHS